jgi:hypothetical protein
LWAPIRRVKRRSSWHERNVPSSENIVHAKRVKSRSALISDSWNSRFVVVMLILVQRPKQMEHQPFATTVTRLSHKDNARLVECNVEISPQEHDIGRIV